MTRNLISVGQLLSTPGFNANLDDRTLDFPIICFTLAEIVSSHLTNQYTGNTAHVMNTQSQCLGEFEIVLINSTKISRPKENPPRGQTLIPPTHNKVQTLQHKGAL